jgi:hypothetical protein
MELASAEFAEMLQIPNPALPKAKLTAKRSSSCHVRQLRVSPEILHQPDGWKIQYCLKRIGVRTNRSAVMAIPELC